MLKKLIGVLAGAALVLTVAPTSAEAQTAGTVTAVFSASATVDDPVFMPVAINNDVNGGDCTNVVGPVDTCPAVASSGWEFDTALGGIDQPPVTTGGETCVALGAQSDGSEAGTDADTAAVVDGTEIASLGTCDFAAEGTFGELAPGVGAWCGMSQGSGTVTSATVDDGDGTPTNYATLNGVTTTVTWPAGPGSVLPLVFTVTDGTGIVGGGAGAVQVSGLRDAGNQPTQCGADGADNPNGAGKFFVTGFATVSAVA